MEKLDDEIIVFDIPVDEISESPIGTNTVQTRKELKEFYFDHPIKEWSDALLGTYKSICFIDENGFASHFEPEEEEAYIQLINKEKYYVYLKNHKRESYFKCIGSWSFDHKTIDMICGYGERLHPDTQRLEPYNMVVRYPIVFQNDCLIIKELEKIKVISPSSFDCESAGNYGYLKIE